MNVYESLDVQENEQIEKMMVKIENFKKTCLSRKKKTKMILDAVMNCRFKCSWNAEKWKIRHIILDMDKKNKYDVLFEGECIKICTPIKYRDGYLGTYLDTPNIIFTLKPGYDEYETVKTNVELMWKKSDEKHKQKEKMKKHWYDE